MYNQEEKKQMVREIAGFMKENQAGLDEVLEEYCSGMSAKEIDSIELRFNSLKNKTKPKTIIEIELDINKYTDTNEFFIPFEFN